MAAQHTIIEELDEPDMAQYDADFNKILKRLGDKPELLLECVMEFLQRSTTLLTTAAGRDKANTIISNYIKRPSTGPKPMQAGFFGKSAAVASPASRRDTPAEKQVLPMHHAGSQPSLHTQAQATTSDARAQELLDQVVKAPPTPSTPEEADKPSDDKPKGLSTFFRSVKASRHVWSSQNRRPATVLRTSATPLRRPCQR